MFLFHKRESLDEIPLIYMRKEPILYRSQRSGLSNPVNGGHQW